MKRHLPCLAAAVLVWIAPAAASAQAPKSYALESAAGLRLHNVAAEPATLAGQKGLRVTLGPGAEASGEQLAVIEGLEFSSGVTFYLRPTNGRAEDQERRNHAVQYISHPAWTWDRMRKETPSRYEAYVDLQPAVWTKVRIEVRGDRARLYVHGNEQPTLVVNDVKTGASAKGAVALWLGPGTIAHFRNLRVAAEPGTR
jgi:hypothetical protein